MPLVLHEDFYSFLAWPNQLQSIRHNTLSEEQIQYRNESSTKKREEILNGARKDLLRDGV